MDSKVGTRAGGWEGGGGDGGGRLSIRAPRVVLVQQTKRRLMEADRQMDEHTDGQSE